MARFIVTITMVHAIREEPVSMDSEQLITALEQAWCQETSYYGRTKWSAVNPAWGQCASTALVIRSVMGGHIVRSVARLPGGIVIPHYYNILPDGATLDATRIQFPPETTFSAPKRHSPSGRNVKRRAEILARRSGI